VSNGAEALWCEKFAGIVFCVMIVVENGKKELMQNGNMGRC
jgi:hypothetical protein